MCNHKNSHKFFRRHSGIGTYAHGLTQELEKLFGLLCALFRGSHREVSTLDALVAVSKIQHLRRLYMQDGWGRVHWNNKSRGYKSMEDEPCPSEGTASQVGSSTDSVFPFLERMVGKYCLSLAALGFGNCLMLRSYTGAAEVLQASQQIAQHRRSQQTRQFLRACFCLLFCESFHVVICLPRIRRSCTTRRPWCPRSRITRAPTVPTWATTSLS